MSEKIRVCLVGANGKMGKAIRQVIAGDSSFGEVITVDPDLEKGPVDWTELNTIDVPFDMAVNFTNPEATLESARLFSKIGKPLVTGTTGLSGDQLAELKQLSLDIPILNDYNMSLGVNLLNALLPRVAEPLAKAGWEFELIELHHKMKKDSPSGTAERFARTMQSATGKGIAYGREKGSSQGRDERIYVHSLRMGTIPGEHTIYFAGPDEVIEIHHRALSNKIFALGAVRAVKWIIGKEPGLYSMKDVLGL